ncbi:MAG TPA: ion channel [Candidatus Acidoferrales bacterium]|nr:ion channel [Candidatus Acidoferrales bacterium]
MKILPAIAGFLIISGILLEAFETIVLPRRVTRRFRLTRLYYLTWWRPWRKLAQGVKSPKRREGFLSYFGPLSLLGLFALWAAMLIVGFGLLYYSDARLDQTHPTLETCFYLSGTTFFTLGLGDVTPHTAAERILAVFESGLGFGFLALVLSYLPVIYQAFSRREVAIVLLDARAGSPPTATELLRRHAGVHGLEALERLLRDWERWGAELLESHVSYPVLTYFRSQHNNESWLSALTAMLDTSALVISGADGACQRQARLTFAICRHAVVDLAQVFHAPPLAHGTNRLPASELLRLRGAVAESGLKLHDTPESNEKLNKLRDMYEPYVRALSKYLYFDLPPWILAKESADNWKTSAWGRITGFTAQTQVERVQDDHS